MDIIEKKVLANGVEMAVVDESKKMAVDRWLIKFRCIITIPWAGWMDEHIAKEPGEYDDVRKSLEPICYELVRERNFIDTNVKNEIVEEMLSALYENTEKYIKGSSFSENCFLKSLSEWRDRQKMAALVDSQETSDIDEPADFSACFD